MVKYLIVYDSKTGNTQYLAETLHSYLKDESKDIMTVDEFNDSPVEAEVYFVGFWTSRGSCSLAVTDALEQMEGAKIVMFGTCGMGNSPEYYKQIQSRVSVWVPDESQLLGFFLCQGSITEEVWEYYQKTLESMKPDQRQEIQRNYEEGKTHPDYLDLGNFTEFIDNLKGL